MKLCLIVGAVAAALTAVACGGNGTLVGGTCGRDDAYCPPGPGSGSSSSSGGVSSGGASRDAGSTVTVSVDASSTEAASVDAGSTEAASDAGVVEIDSGSSSSSGSGSSSGAAAQPGACIPGNACGGLWECTDDCYTDKCCVLGCSCTDPTGQTGTLECSLTCP